MRKSIKSERAEFSDIRELYKRMRSFMGHITPYAKVMIGGSYALQFFIDAFASREVHDYDIIVQLKDEESYIRVQDILKDLVSLKLATLCSIYDQNPSAFYVGELRGKSVNVLLSQDEEISSTIEDVAFNTPLSIKRAKVKYVLNAQIKGRIPRAKDIEDIHLIDKYLYSEDLPIIHKDLFMDYMSSYKGMQALMWMGRHLYNMHKCKKTGVRISVSKVIQELKQYSEKGTDTGIFSIN